MSSYLKAPFRHSTYPRKILYKLLKLLDRFAPYRRVYRGIIIKKSGKSPPLPSEIAIETTNLCNARCAICAHPVMKRPQGYMDSALVKSLIDQAAAARVRKLFLSGFGEPLLDKRLPEFIALAKNKGISAVAIVTNGHLLREPLAKELIKSGIDEVTISIGGFTDDIYEKVRSGLKLTPIIENVKRFHDLRFKGRPRVNIASVDLITNHGQRHLAKSLLGAYVDSIFFRQAQGWTENIAEEMAAWSPHYEINDIPCRYLWNSINIHIDGKVPACCLDYEGLGNMGDATCQPIEDIWNGRRFTDYRNAHLHASKSGLEPCKNCGYYSVWW